MALLNRYLVLREHDGNKIGTVISLTPEIGTKRLKMGLVRMIEDGNARHVDVKRSDDGGIDFYSRNNGESVIKVTSDGVRGEDVSEIVNNINSLQAENTNLVNNVIPTKANKNNTIYTSPNLFDLNKAFFDFGINLTTGKRYPAAGGVVIEKIPVDPTSHYVLYTLNAAGSKYLVPTGRFVWFDAAGAFISSGSFSASGGTYVSGYVDADIIPPANAAFISLAIYTYPDYPTFKSKKPIFGKLTSYPSRENLVYEPSNSKVRDMVVSIDNPLYGKTMYGDGDSIAYGSGTGISYLNLIADSNGMILTKAAVAGTTIAVRDGRTDSILERLKLQANNTYDIMLIEGGINDMFTSVPLGTLSSGYSATLDETTFIGAMESLCKELNTNHFGSKVLFVLCHRKIGTFAASQATYWAAAITAFEKWSIPYINMMKETNLAAWNDTIGAAYFVEVAGTHPTLNTYKQFYVPLIEAKLKTL